MVFGQGQQGISIMSIAVAMVTLKSRCPLKKKNRLKFHDGQYQFKALFMLYADFDSIAKPVDERYRDKMNIHVPSGWYYTVPLPMEMPLTH